MASIKKLSLLFLFNLALITTASSRGLDSTDYFPLRVGNKWFTICYMGY